MKLELSSEGRYALRTLVYLARYAGSGELVTADRISFEAVVPRRLLARVMAKLARAGLVETSEGRGGRFPPRPTARRGNPARRRGGRGGPVRDHLLHHAATPLRRGPPLRAARRLARGPERHPRTPRVSDACRLLLPGSALPLLAKTYLRLLTIRCGPSILSLFQ
jgi:hypothetical protein